MNFIQKLFHREPYICCMEMHNKFECYCSIEPPCPPAGEGGAKEFYDKYHFSILHNMIDPEWDDKIKLEEIQKKLILIYGFTPDDEDVMIVYKNHKKVYLPNKKYVSIQPGTVFIYDSSKIKIKY